LFSTPPKDAGGHSVAIAAEIQFDPAALLVTWKPAQALPLAPLVKGCPLDAAGRERTEEFNVPGPWLGAANPAALQLSR
jgi:hypothetical protein